MPASANYLQTKEGLFQPSQLRTKDGLFQPAQPANVVLWTGGAWADATIQPRAMKPALDLDLADGTKLTITADTKVLLAGRERYFWQPVSELNEGDLVCRSVSCVSQALVGAHRREAYWIGQLFAANQEVKMGRAVKVRTGIRDNNATIIAEVTKVMSRMNVGARVEHDGLVPLVHFTGPRFKGWLDKMGFVFDPETDLTVDVPYMARAATNTGRRAFCRGVLDSVGVAIDRYWHLELETERRAITTQLMFNSIDVSSTRSASKLLIPQWIASIELGTRTHYPFKSEYAMKEAPLSVCEDFLNGVDLYMKHKAKLHGLPTLLCDILDDQEPVHPRLLRAGWFILRTSPPNPVHDFTPVRSVLPRHDNVAISNVEVANVDHSLDVNGYVVGDTMR